MYTHHMNGLGEEPVAVAEPSMWDNLLKLGTSAVTTGFNIYNKVQTLTQQKKAAAVAQTQAQQFAQYSSVYGQPMSGRPMIPGQPMYGQQTDFFGGWTMPLLIAGAAVVGFVMLKRK